MRRFSLLLVLWLAAAPVGAELRGVVEVSGDRPLPLAVAPASGSPDLVAGVTEALRGALVRSHWFEVVRPSDPGASFLVNTSVRAGTDEVVLQGVVLAADGTRQLGKEYRVGPGLLRAAVHRFADEVVHELTGEVGIASTALAYVADHQGRPAIFSVAPDGGEPRKLVSGPFECLFPRFAPASSSLVYTAYPRGFPELMLYDPLTDRNRSLSARPGMNSLGALSPGGDRVAATLSFEGNPEVYLLDLAGRVLRRLTENRGNDLSPTWSPDGSRIAFVSDRAGAPAVYVVDVEAPQEPRRLTHGFDSSSHCVSPAWSPKGDYLAFCARMSDGFDVMVLRLADGEMFRVTEGGGDEESPDWAPDNRHLVVAATRGRVTRLEVLDVRHPENRYAIPLTAATGVRDPTWGKVVR